MNRSFVTLITVAATFIPSLPSISNAQTNGLQAIPPGARFVGPVEHAGVTGIQRNEVRVIVNASTPRRGIYGLKYGERRDHSCFIEVFREKLSEAGTDFSSALDLCGNNGPTTRSTRFVGFPDPVTPQAVNQPDQHAFVRGIEVCFNKNQTRIKGIKLFGTRVDPVTGELGPVSGSVVPVGVSSLPQSQSDKHVRPNCDAARWQDPVFCSDGHVATSILAHVSPGSSPREIVGLELRCRRTAGTILPGPGGVKRE